MINYRSFVLAGLGPIAFFLTLTLALPTAPTKAQDIGAWGVWGHWNNDQGRRHRTGRPPRQNYGYSGDGYNGNPAYTNTPNKGRVFPALMNGGARPVIDPQAPEIIELDNTEEPGTILIDTKARTLYLTLNAYEAYAYPISVGRIGYTWTGTEQISRIAQWPDWHPPEEMRQREPGLPVKMMGGIRNPLGAVAIYLGDTLYRIHGTNDPKSIGRAASSGCFRMLNAHAIHLASQAEIGTVVKVVPSLESLEAASVATPLPTRSGS